MATLLRDGVIPPGHWLRGDVRVDRDELVLDEETLTLYRPARETDLVWEFAAIETDDDALAFASRYGLLRRTPPQVLREPLFSWHAEVGLVRGTLGLYADLVAGLGGADGMAELRLRWAETSSEDAAPPGDEAILREIRSAILASLNRGLEGTQVEMSVDDGEFRLQPVSPTLFGLIHYRLAGVVGGEVPVRRCLECDRLFAPRDGRQRFCTERHASRARLRRHRSRALQSVGAGS